MPIIDQTERSIIETLKRRTLFQREHRDVLAEYDALNRELRELLDQLAEETEQHRLNHAHDGR